ncbi:MAG: glycosyltransferase family 2 protein [Lentisphaeria bacterium]|nr:glycosyltransferase family 2 protein [Lentisphaeria bacterium]
MDKRKKIISITAGCFNEAENLAEFYDRWKKVLDALPEYDYEFVIADNCSTDGSREILRDLAKRDPKFRVILNAGNFGHIRSPYNAILNTRGDLVVPTCSDLQDPPEMLPELLKEYEKGNRIVCAVRSATHAGKLMEVFRRMYYSLLRKVSPGENVFSGFTGYGIYDRVCVDALKKYHDPYPYFRGLIAEIGFRPVTVPYVQDKRRRGRTKNNFFTLYDMAMTGLVHHSKVPLRLAVFAGILLGIVSLAVAVVYFILKLVWWDTFSLGLAPLVIGLFFFSSVQLFFIGIIGEYLGAVWTQVRNRPLVIEEERINFD